jgi:hypothetical protein
MVEDCGKSLSKRPKQNNDCTVIALAISCHLQYDVAYDYLERAGRKCSKGFRFKNYLKDTVINTYDCDYSFHWQPFQAVKGEKRMNPVSFIEKFPKGTYIVKTAKHVFVIMDGIGLGSWQERDDRCIYGAWEVKRTPRKYTP